MSLATARTTRTDDLASCCRSRADEEGTLMFCIIAHNYLVFVATLK